MSPVPRRPRSLQRLPLDRRRLGVAVERELVVQRELELGAGLPVERVHAIGGQAPALGDLLDAEPVAEPEVEELDAAARVLLVAPRAAGGRARARARPCAQARSNATEGVVSTAGSGIAPTSPNGT